VKPFYSDDLVTLYHGDCRDIAPTLTYGAVVSDPPYGMGWDTATRRFSGGNNPNRRIAGRHDARPVSGDAEPFDPSPWLGCEHVILWGANHYGRHLPVGTTLVWIKKNDESFGTFLSDAEVAWKKGGHGVYCRRDLSMNAIARERAHPTQKPLSIMLWCLLFVPQELTILDPFAGSGTTLRAAKDLGRKSIGIEIDEHHCRTAADRLSQNALDLGGAA
jgi:site-specific DNA-methyltransferase (adenine-specific)